MSAALRFIVEAGTADPKTIDPIAWLGLADRAARSQKAATLRDGALALHTLLDKRRADLGPAQLSRSADIARHLLEAAWTHTDQASGAPTLALTCVLAVFDEAPAENAALLSRLFTNTELPDREDAIRTLAYRVPDLLRAPELVAGIYQLVAHDVAARNEKRDRAQAAWLKHAHEELASAGEVPRGEDCPWDGLVGELAEDAEVFLRATPTDAVFALARAIGEFWRPLERSQELRVAARQFPVRYWLTQDALGVDFDDMLIRSVVEAFVENVAADPTRASDLISKLVEAEAPVPIWGLLVQRMPEVPAIVEALPELLDDPRNVLILARSIEIALGRSPGLPPHAMARLRAAIRRLGTDELALAVAEDLRTALDAPTTPGLPVDEPEPEPEDNIGTIWVLRERRGMSLDEIALPSNRAARAVQRAAETRIAALHQLVQGAKPSVSLQSLSDHGAAARGLVAAAATLASRAQADDLCGTAASLASLIARLGDPSVRDLLLDASRRPITIETPHDVDVMNQLRGEAAYESISGLVALADGGKPDLEAADRLRELAHDSRTGLRYAVAGGLGRVARLFFWDELTTLIVAEPDASVVSEAVGELGHFLPFDRDRSLDLALQAFKRRWSGGRYVPAAADNLRGEALRLVLFYDLRYGEGTNSTIAAAIGHLFEHLEDYAEPIRSVLHRFSGWLTIEDARDGGGAEATRARTWGFLEHVVRRAVDIVAHRRGVEPSFDVNARVDGEHTALAKVLENTSFWPYVVAGGAKTHDFDKSFDDETRRKASIVWRHGRASLELLASAGHRESMFHVLDALIPILRSSVAARSPAAPCRSDVFATFLAVTESALGAGQAADWRTWNLFDRVIRWMAREHATELTSSSHVATISRMIDRFLAAGSRQAYLLARDLAFDDRA